MARELPRALVHTWIMLLESSEQKEVKNRASEMIINAFGNLGAAKCYLEKSKRVRAGSRTIVVSKQ